MTEKIVPLVAGVAKFIYPAIGPLIQLAENMLGGKTGKQKHDLVVNALAELLRQGRDAGKVIMEGDPDLDALASAVEVVFQHAKGTGVLREGEMPDVETLQVFSSGKAVLLYIPRGCLGKL